jgi:DNA polymerase III subunit epsilon
VTETEVTKAEVTEARATKAEVTRTDLRAGLGLAEGLDLVIVDVETTGFLPAQDTIIEIGAVRLRGARETGEFFTLVNPARPVPAGITELTGITEAMVSQAPPAADALAAFLAFARGSVLVAHNAPFDLGFLTAGCRQAGLAWPPAAVLDTAALARLILTTEQVPDYKLASLAAFFGTQAVPSHRALADAQATAEVLTGLLGLSAARGAGLIPMPPPAPPRPAPDRAADLAAVSA